MQAMGNTKISGGPTFSHDLPGFDDKHHSFQSKIFADFGKPVIGRK
jgi:hypothetical protein